MQRWGHGWYFLFNLMFRPVMLVGLYQFSQLLITAIFSLFVGAVTGFISSLADNSSSAWADLLMIYGMIWVIIAFAEQVITTGMGIIFTGPDRVFAFVGGHFSNGGAGGDMEQGTGQKAKGMMDSQGKSGSEVMQTVGKSAGDYRNQKDHALTQQIRNADAKKGGGGGKKGGGGSDKADPF